MILENAVGESSCQHAEYCGGCMYRGVPYEEQLKIKNEIVLGELAKNDIRPGEYTGIIAAPYKDHYRNKMEYTFGDEVKGGDMLLGLHRKRSYISIIDVDGCRIIPQDFDVIRKAALAFVTERGHTFMHKKTKQGFLRNLSIRRGENTGELLVNLVTTSQESLDEEAFCEALRSLDLEGDIVGILHTIYDGKADKLGCDSMSILYGRDHYYEDMLGLRFSVSTFSFFQTNTAAAEVMFSDIRNMLPDIDSKTIFDLYCGTGAISLVLAGRADKVTGIEIVGEAVIAARQNAELNDIRNTVFLEGDALNVMETLNERPDIIVTDPPRMGMHPKALKKVIDFAPPEMLYVSCNPKTFCENMAVLTAAGYKLESMRAYDNYPFTKHIETVGHIIR